LKNWADRFAEQLLKDNLRLEEFQVVLIGDGDIDSIVSRLTELGCEVDVEKKTRRLKVVIPHGSGPIEEFKRRLAGGEKSFRPKRKRNVDLFALIRRFGELATRPASKALPPGA